MTEYCRNETGFFNGCGQFSHCEYSLQHNADICYHDSAFDVTPWIGVVYTLMPMFIGLGMIGGLGGGILKGPFLEVILNYSQSAAIHISYCLMFGGTLLNTPLLLFESHPYMPERPIINFEIAIILNLAIPLATNVGSSLAGFLPQIYVLSIQTLFLIAVSPIIWNKAMKQMKQERQLKASMNQSHNSLISENIESSKMDEPLFVRFKHESQDRLPVIPLLIIFGSFIMNQIIIQMRATGSQTSIVGFAPCILADNLVLLVLVLANIVYTVVIWMYGRKRELLKDTVGFMPNERYFNPLSKFLLIYAGGFGAGMVAGLLGLGAGLVMVPTLLQAGLVARCASSTSAFNYFMISLNNLTTLLTQHLLPWDMIALFSGLALIGGSVFTKIGYFLMNKYKVGYIVVIIVFALGIVNIFSGIYYGVVTGERYSMETLLKVNKQCAIVQ